MNDNTLTQALVTLSQCSVPAIPLDSSKWKAYIVQLRKHILGMNQSEFWGIFGVKQVSGSRYESQEDDVASTNISKAIPKTLMVQIADKLHLSWDVPSPVIGSDGAPTQRGLALLNLLNEYNIEDSDLRKLLDLHRHYRN